MNKDTAFRALVLVAVSLLAYIVWTNTKELVDLELELDKLRGAVNPVSEAPPVPPAEPGNAPVG